MPNQKLSIILILVSALILSSCTTGANININEQPEDTFQHVKATVERLIPDIDWDKIQLIDFSTIYSCLC